MYCYLDYLKETSMKFWFKYAHSMLPTLLHGTHPNTHFEYIQTTPHNFTMVIKIFAHAKKNFPCPERQSQDQTPFHIFWYLNCYIFHNIRARRIFFHSCAHKKLLYAGKTNNNRYFLPKIFKSTKYLKKRAKFGCPTVTYNRASWHSGVHIYVIFVSSTIIFGTHINIYATLLHRKYLNSTLK